MKHRCDEFRSLVGDYSDLGALSIDERSKFEDHLAECVDCLASLKGMVVQRSVLRALFREPAFREPVAEPPLSEALVARCVLAMKRAAHGGAQEAGERTG